MSEREKLLKHVQVCDFALVEASLFLDTHPDNQAALAYYKKHLKMREEYARAYQAQYGPLDHSGVEGERWSWVDGLWPWQTEEEAK